MGLQKLITDLDMSNGYKGGPWVSPLVKQNLNRTQKYEVIAFKNNKKHIFKDFTRGGPWAPSHTKQNLNRTKFMKFFTTWGRNIWYGWANEDVAHMYIHLT